jgi:hypothetical protein
VEDLKLVLGRVAEVGGPSDCSTRMQTRLLDDWRRRGPMALSGAAQAAPPQASGAGAACLPA